MPENLRDLRIKKGWNKTVASERVGINRIRYHRIETLGRMPSLLEALNIAETYGIKDIKLLKKIFFDQNVQNMNNSEAKE